MKERNALRIALVMSGKYDLPETLVVKGFDQFGQLVEERMGAINEAALESDMTAILNGERPSPLRRISSIEPGEGL